MKEVIILGGIGNGSVIADAISHAKVNYGMDVSVIGFLNDRVEKGELIAGYPVLGKLSDYREFPEVFFINSIYRIDGQEKRIDLFMKLKIPESSLLTFIHPQAYVAPSARIGTGAVIMPNVSVSSEAVIGKCTLIMAGATVGHNTTIGEFCHLAAQACTGSFVKICTGCHVGLNATIRENVAMAEYSALGMGSVLLTDTNPGEIWVGNPAKYLRKAEN